MIANGVDLSFLLLTAKNWRSEVAHPEFGTLLSEGVIIQGAGRSAHFSLGIPRKGEICSCMY